MTIEEAIAKIPVGWRLRLTNWEDDEESGWGAVLYHRTRLQVVGDEKEAVAAILAAIANIKER